MSIYGDTGRTANVRTLPSCELCRKSVWKRGRAGTSSMPMQYVGKEPFLFHIFVMKTCPHHHITVRKSSGNVVFHRRSDGSCRTISSVVTISRRLRWNGFSCVFG